jgi:hypothetical protein
LKLVVIRGVVQIEQNTFIEIGIESVGTATAQSVIGFHLRVPARYVACRQHHHG